MVSLLESKLYSLPPDITSKYPQLNYYSLNDINPQISSTNIYEIKKNEVKAEIPQQTTEDKKIELAKVEEILENVVYTEESPEQKLRKFLEENNSDGLENIYKMLKFGISEQAVLQKARFVGIEPDIVSVKQILINFRN